jgi:pimeloyl-ACP methyl ester carboxylesterase
MHFECRGSGDPILFIHGIPTSNHLWNGIIERLLERHTCFAVDLPGLGKSPSTPYGPKYLQSLAEDIDALRIKHRIDKWHVVGHDAGSAVAVHYAHNFQQHVGCMALLSPALFPELRPYYLLEALRKPILGEVFAPLINLLFWKIAMQRALDDDLIDADEIVNDFREPFSGFSGAWRFMRLMRWGKPAEVLADVPGFLPQLLIPTLIFHGSRDAAIPKSFADRASALIPNSATVSLDTGHFIPLNRPEAVAVSLMDFFAQQTGQN